MTNIKPASNVQAAGALAGLTVAILSVLEANGVHIPQDAATLLSASIPVLVAWGHDISTGNNS